MLTCRHGGRASGVVVQSMLLAVVLAGCGRDSSAHAPRREATRVVTSSPAATARIAQTMRTRPASAEPRPLDETDRAWMARMQAMADCLAEIPRVPMMVSRGGNSIGVSSGASLESIQTCGRLAARPGTASEQVDGGVDGHAEAAPATPAGTTSWQSFIGTWRGGSRGCHEAITILPSPDERRRIVVGTGTGCGDPLSYAATEFTADGSEWRARVGHGVVLHIDPQKADGRQIWLTGTGYIATLRKSSASPEATTPRSTTRPSSSSRTRSQEGSFNRPSSGASCCGSCGGTWVSTYQACPGADGACFYRCTHPM